MRKTAVDLLRCRLEDALQVVKSLARQHRSMQQHTLNSLVRALARSSPGRALRVLSLMQTMGMRAESATFLTLIRACARSSMSARALELYW